ncbi:magnesium transporter CorA family protein [Limnochorda pilosa]|uniref:Magnesium transport protein CorA n=1 Tax=Limnochorda pilosa TaxID=1555112 RepID=A0A0K2SHV0_LIMPI|nr:magnesium transporter CorA family protein [Limnochorda pilosa]BAS26650.1 hypothetical protein LIP_0793 [Limnochorda pilosa]
MLHALLWQEGSVTPLEGTGAVLEAHRHGQGLLWLDLHQPEPSELDLLREGFGFHPLAVEDCALPSELPKLEPYPGYAFLIFHGLASSGRQGRPGVKLLEIDLFFAPGAVVTSHLEPAPHLDRLRERLPAQPQPMARGAAFLLHTILDETVNEMEPLVAAWEEEVDRLDDGILGGDATTLRRILALRRRFKALGRRIALDSPVIRSLASPSGPVQEETAYAYFRDVDDHLRRLEDRLTALHEGMATAAELYLSLRSQEATAAANRANLVMERLTVVATFFMPLTFVTSLYGMNFRFMPELEWRWGYPAVLLAMAAIAYGLYLDFRRRGWI